MGAEPRTTHDCPACDATVGPTIVSRKVYVRCSNCGITFNSFSHRIETAVDSARIVRAPLVEARQEH
jgi:ribosomal protein L37AE/L43A